MARRLGETASRVVHRQLMRATFTFKTTALQVSLALAPGSPVNDFRQPRKIKRLHYLSRAERNLCNFRSLHQYLTGREGWMKASAPPGHEA